MSEPLASGDLSGGTRKAVTAPAVVLAVAAFCLGVFHLAVVSGVLQMSTLPMRIIHVALAFSLLFAIKPLTPGTAGTRLDLVLRGILIVAILGASWWMLGRWKAIAFSGGLTEPGISGPGW